MCVLFPLHVETYLMHWIQGIEDTYIYTYTLDIDEYYYLFMFSAVRTQYNQREYLRGSQRGLKKETLKKGLCNNNNNNHKCKYQ